MADNAQIAKLVLIYHVLSIPIPSKIPDIGPDIGADTRIGAALYINFIQ